MKLSLPLFLSLIPTTLAATQTQAAQPFVVDFSNFAAGATVDTISAGQGATGALVGYIEVNGYNKRPKLAGQNTAMIFDSSCPRVSEAYPDGGECSGGDQDLGTPNEAFGGPGEGAGGGAGKFANKIPRGNILINTEDGKADNPDDANFMGMYFDFDFANVEGSVTLDSITYLDVEADQGEDGVYVVVYSNGLSVPDMIAIPPTGDNGLNTIKGIKISNVDKIRFNQNGSGGLVEMGFTSEEAGECWSTTGGFLNAGSRSGPKDFTLGGNVGPPSSGVWEVVDHTTKNNFHSNDVEVTECGVVADLTGPGQPGGKKGFDTNLLKFRGTGRLRVAATGEVVDGLTFTGCVMDAGEPAGKKGLDKDYFEIVVCKAGVTDCGGSGLCATDTLAEELTAPKPQLECEALPNVAFAACGSLDGGNVQLHPPVGKP